MTKCLLDTDILSEPLKPQPNAFVLSRLKMHEDEIATASPVWHELHFGCKRLPNSKKRERIESFLMEA